jgi:hypothetical protein
MMRLDTGAALLALGTVWACGWSARAQSTVVGIAGSRFTIDGHPTYTPAAGFPNADANLAGTLVNVRAVQAIFDDANYPRQGSATHPYRSNTMGAVAFDYPGGKWNPERQTDEFVQGLPDWRRCGVLAFTVNLQGGGPTDGNYGENGPTQPHNNSAFDAHGELKPDYAGRLAKVLAAADRLGMIAIVGLFYQGENQRIENAPDGRYVKRAIESAIAYLKQLGHRNVLIEVNNEVSVGGYSHPILQPDGVLEALKTAKAAAGGLFPVSTSWSGGIQARSARADAAVAEMDYILIHTNGKTPEQVRETIAASRRLGGTGRPLVINEDGVSAFNLEAAVGEGVGWGFYDQGWNNYRDGFQSPPTNWGINTPVKWLFFEQVARLTGSPAPPIPRYETDDSPVIQVIGLTAGQVVKDRIWVEAVVQDRHPRWPIKRVEFYLDDRPYSYSRNAPWMLGNTEWWSPASLSPGRHVLRVAAFDMRGPRFTECASFVEIPFIVAR